MALDRWLDRAQLCWVRLDPEQPRVGTGFHREVFLQQRGRDFEGRSTCRGISGLEESDDSKGWRVALTLFRRQNAQRFH